MTAYRPARIEITPASPAHIGTIANRLRPDDVTECRAMGRTPKEALRLGLQTSSESWTAKVDGRPEAMFGLNITNALCGCGVPWMLGTEAIYRHPKAMIRGGDRLLARWLDSTPNLANLTSVGNHRALRLLRRWGFEIAEEVTVFSGVEFVRFSMER